MSSAWSRRTWPSPRATPPSWGDEDRQVVGLITYATEAEPLQRMALSAPGGRDGDLPLEWSPKLLWITAREPDGHRPCLLRDQEGDAKDVYTGITAALKLDDIRPHRHPAGSPTAWRQRPGDVARRICPERTYAVQ